MSPSLPPPPSYQNWPLARGIYPDGEWTRDNRLYNKFTFAPIANLRIWLVPPLFSRLIEHDLVRQCSLKGKQFLTFGLKAHNIVTSGYKILEFLLKQFDYSGH